MVAEKIHEIWRHRLALPSVDYDDDFFDLGGTSLIMTHIQQEIIKEFGVEIPMDRLLRESTVAKVSAHLDSLLPAQGS